MYRMTVFTFVVEDAQEVPTVTFMGEQPYLQYVSKPRMANNSASRMFK